MNITQLMNILELQVGKHLSFPLESTPIYILLYMLYS